MPAKAKRPATPALEWIAAAIGLLLLAAVFTVIGREAITAEEQRPPQISVEVTRIAPNGSGFLVEFDAVNHSGSTAAAVQIEGTLGPETSTATLDYVAGNARTSGGLFFTWDPRGQPLELRATGYQSP